MEKGRIRSWLLIVLIGITGMCAGAMITARYLATRITDNMISNAATNAKVDVYTLIVLREKGDAKTIELLESNLDRTMEFLSKHGKAKDNNDNYVSDVISQIEEYRKKYPRDTPE